MNVAFVNPFIIATITSFKTLLNVDVTPGTPSTKHEPFPTFDISGVIGLSGDAQGSIAMSFPKIMALKVVSGMLGTDLRVVGPELADGIGELANIVAGNAKQHLHDYKLSISLPNVVIGKGHILVTQSGIPTLIIPFTSTLGDFVIEVSLKTN